MKPLFALLALAWSIPWAAGQIPLQESDFLRSVLDDHPIARQAELLDDQAAAYLQKARGAFDPKLFGGNKSKEYGDKSYYDYLGTGISAETRLGVAIEANWNRTEGEFLNPESTLPESGLWSVGATVRLGQGLFTDERRTALRQAEAYVDLNAAQRTAALNDLLLAAAGDYWKWYKANEAATVASEAERLALERLEGIRASLIGGDRAAIDTVEARLRWSTRRMEAAAAASLLAASRAKAEAWLWDPAGRPLALGDGVVPVRPADPAPRLAWVQGALLNDMARAERWTNHPLRETLLAKTEINAAEIRLRQELLKPQLDARFLALSETAEFGDLGNQYALELKYAVPLFLRKERGALALARIEGETIALDFDEKARKWEAAAVGAGTAWAAQVAQWEAALEAESLAATLLEAEEVKFEVGESSLFLLNSREASLMKARKERIDAEGALSMAWREMGWIWGEPQP